MGAWFGGHFASRAARQRYRDHVQAMTEANPRIALDPEILAGTPVIRGTRLSVEFVLGLPPKIKAVATGPLAFLGEVLEARNVAPTVLVNYHFGSAGDTWRPYLGFGLNYTHFTNISTPYGWDVKLTDSAGMAVQAGMDYAISKQWGLYASVARVDVRTKLVATGATVLQSKIDFRPWTYSFGASYKF